MDLISVPLLPAATEYIGSKMVLKNEGSVNLEGMLIDKNLATDAQLKQEF